jgi:hypothetical protein
MSLDLEIIPKKDHLRVRVTGTYDVNEAIERFPETLAACRSTGLNKMLIDFRPMKGVPAATEKLIYGLNVREYYQTYVSHYGIPPQIAYVGCTPAVSSYEPGIDVMKNEGLPFAMFTCIQDACDWLEIVPDPEPLGIASA